jgi:hypothetical protein
MSYAIYDHTGKLIESGESIDEPIILREGPEEETE